MNKMRIYFFLMLWATKLASVHHKYRRVYGNPPLRVGEPRGVKDGQRWTHLYGDGKGNSDRLACAR